MNDRRGLWKKGWALGGMLFLLWSPLTPLRAQQAIPENQTSKTGANAANSNDVKLQRQMEDWSNITLENSNLTPIKPVPGELDRRPKYTRERTLVQWRPIDGIDLYIIKPVGVEKPPVIFYLYSYETASKQTFMNDGWCQRVTSGGFAAVAFVPALTEDRFRMRPMKEWFVSELQESLATTTHDVQMIINYLETRHDLDVSTVRVFGIGSGATVGILAAAADPRIEVLDLVNPWGEWPMWLRTSSMVAPEERAEFLKPEFLAKVAPLDPVKWLPKLTTQQIRLQIIDESVGAQKLAMDSVASAAPKNAKVVHFATVAQHKTATVADRGSFQWVKEQMEPPIPLRRTDEAETHSGAPDIKP